MKEMRLNNGVTMPQLGLGVYQISNEDLGEIIPEALDIGYRAFDTAQIYKNEEGLGRALEQSHHQRDELFITTKVWNSHQGYERTLEAFEQSLERLRMDYIDLYLVHWPMPKEDKYIETYQALEELYKAGKVRAIGVSNFHIEHLERLLQECEVKPVVNQVECHPYFQQKELKQFCRQHDIAVQAWRPIDRADEVFQDGLIQELAKKYHKTPAQIILRWHLQEDTIIIPKTKTPSRLRENFNIFDFSLTEGEMEKIQSLDQNKRRGHDPNDMHQI